MSTKTSSRSSSSFLILILIQLGCDSLRFNPEIESIEISDDEGGFEIESLSITYPMSGESFDPGTIVSITWDSMIDTCEWGVNIILFRDNEDESNIAINTPNDGSFDWYIDTELDHDEDYQIRIDGLCNNGDFCNGCIYSQSPGSFTITQNVVEPYILVIAPNGGETFELGEDSVQVSWDTNVPDCIWGMKIVLYKQSEEIVTLGYDTPNDGVQNFRIHFQLWDIEPANDYLIYVESLCKNGTTFCGGCYGDFSDAPFRLYLNELVLINPNGGEVWTRGETETITWTNDSTTQNVHLELWKGGSELQDIYYLLENEFFYVWAPLYELTSGDDYQIKVVSWETNKSDMSDETFTIE